MAKLEKAIYQNVESLNHAYIETRSAEAMAKILICLIHQANYLLDQLLRRLAQDFLKEGGLRERMTRARITADRKPSRDRPAN